MEVKNDFQVEDMHSEMKVIICIFVYGRLNAEVLLLLAVLLTMVGCPQKNDLAQNEREIRKYQLASKMASEGLESALKQVEENKSAGLVKLYEIATNDDEYSVEISEVANEKLHYYLYLKTEFWIRTFAKVDLNQFKQYLKRSDVEVFSLPEGLTPAEKFRAQMLQNLKKFKGTDKEMDLVNYVLELYQQ